MLWLRVPQAPQGRPWQGALLDSPLCRLVREEERRSTEEAAMLADSAKGAGRADRLRSEVRAEGQDARRQLKTINEERAQLQVGLRVPRPVWFGCRV